MPMPDTTAEAFLTSYGEWRFDMYIVFPRIRLRVSVFAIPAFLILLWLEGAYPFAVMLASAAGHELGHLLALFRLGYRVRRVDILPMSALIVCPEGINDRDEMMIALSGPAVSLALSAASVIAFSFIGSELLLFSAVINAAFGVFNLLPILKLDGGKALFCFLSYKNKEAAKQICLAASHCAIILFVSFAIFCAYLSGFNFGVIALSLTLILQIT